MHRFILSFAFFSFFTLINTTQNNQHIPPVLPKFMLTQQTFEFYIQEIRKACSQKDVISQQNLITTFTAYKHQAIAYNNAQTHGPEKLFIKWLAILGNTTTTQHYTITSALNEHFFNEKNEIERYIQDLKTCISTAQATHEHLKIYKEALDYYKTQIPSYECTVKNQKVYELEYVIKQLEQQTKMVQKNFCNTLYQAHIHNKFKENENTIAILEAQGELYNLTPKLDIEVILLIDEPNCKKTAPDTSNKNCAIS